MAVVPDARRKLVTGHESLGYFAQRYEFRLIGAIIPSLTTSAEPSAADLAALAEKIRAAQVPAIFTELGTSPAVAKAIGDETGAKVVELTTHAAARRRLVRHVHGEHRGDTLIADNLRVSRRPARPRPARPTEREEQPAGTADRSLPPERVHAPGAGGRASSCRSRARSWARSSCSGASPSSVTRWPTGSCPGWRSRSCWGFRGCSAPRSGRW